MLQDCLSCLELQVAAGRYHQLLEHDWQSLYIGAAEQSCGHTASWPSYKWQKPRMNLLLYSPSAAISMRRILYMSVKKPSNSAARTQPQM